MNYLKYVAICALLMCLCIQSGCRSKSRQDSQADAKLDASLRMKLREARQADSDSLIQCLVKLNGAFDAEKKKVLHDSGITILTVVKEIITIAGDPDAVRKMATLDFVHSISLSQTRVPPEKQ